MKNREFVNPFNVSKDTGTAKVHGSRPEIEPVPKKTIPMNTGEKYNPNTVAAKRDSFGVDKPGYQIGGPHLQPGGRVINSYRGTYYKSDSVVFKEHGKTVKRDGAIGRVVVKTNHPNTDLNKLYTGSKS